MSPEREERQKQHIRMLHEFFIAECRDNIVEYQQWIEEATARGDRHGREMWEESLARAKESLAQAEARQLPV